MEKIDERVRVTPGIDTLFRVWVGGDVVLATDDMSEAGRRAREERWLLRPRSARLAIRFARLLRRFAR